MHRLMRCALLLGYLGIVAFLNYELVAKSPRLVGGSWPGWQIARQADSGTPWRAWTGIDPLDRLLHEGQEAVNFYRSLSGRPAPQSRLPVLQVPQQS